MHIYVHTCIPTFSTCCLVAAWNAFADAAHTNPCRHVVFEVGFWLLNAQPQLCRQTHRLESRNNTHRHTASVCSYVAHLKPAAHILAKSTDRTTATTSILVQ